MISKRATLLSCSITIMLGALGIATSPIMDDIYNEIYSDTRLSDPESTLFFFCIFPFMHIISTIVFLKNYDTYTKENIISSKANLYKLASVIFILASIYRLLRAWAHF